MNYQEKVKQFQIAGCEDLNSGLTPLRKSLLKEEIQELEDAIKANDRVEMLDALCDIKYINDGNANLINEEVESIDDCWFYNQFIMKKKEELIKSLKHIDLDNVWLINLQVILIAGSFEFSKENFKTALERVHFSNMSKFCCTEQEAIESVISYKDKGVDVYSKQNGNKWVIYRLSDNKILKSKYYTPVDLKDLI